MSDYAIRRIIYASVDICLPEVVSKGEDMKLRFVIVRLSIAFEKM